jgi:Transposase DDE domain
MSINHLYHTSLQQLRQLRPRERITRVRAFAALMGGIMLSKSVHLSHIALKIEGHAKEPSVTRRLERLLANPAVRVREWYAPIACAWLQSQARTTGEVRLILDSTKVSFAHQQVMVALAFQRRAIPIVWSWRVGAKGHSSARFQIALLAYIRSLLPSDVRVLLVGDSEFESGELQAQLEMWGWRYVLRQKPNNQVYCPSQSCWQSFGSLVSHPGQSVWVAAGRLTQRHQRRVNLLAHWAEGEKEPWLLATNLPTRRAVLRAYRRRMWLDELFGDLKGHGFELEHSHLRHFARLSRLTLAVVLLYAWLVTTAVRVIKRGLRQQVDRHDRRDLSIFQIGLRWIERCLKNCQPLTMPFAPMDLKLSGS